MPPLPPAALLPNDMAHIQIQCQNCGTKYKIPEAFQSDTARCKQCGSTIDVASQRDAAPDEAAAKPASRRGGRGAEAGRAQSGRGARSGRRSSRRRRGEDEPQERSPARSSRASAPAAGGRRRRGRRRDEEDEGGDEGGRPRRQRKKDPTPIIVGAIIGILAIVTVILVYTGWDKVTEKVKIPGAEDKYAEAQKRKAEEAERERQEQLAAARAEQDRLAREAAEKKEAEKKAKAAAARKKIPVKVEKLEDVFVPAKLEKVAWSDSVKKERRKELEELVDLAIQTGLSGSRAQRKLEETGWPALVPITNKLLAFDYKTTRGNNDAFVLGQIVQRITGWDPQMTTMTPGEKVEPQIAHDNAIGVYQLHIKMRKYWTSEAGLKDWQRKNLK